MPIFKTLSKWLKVVLFSPSTKAHPFIAGKGAEKYFLVFISSRVNSVTLLGSSLAVGVENLHTVESFNFWESVLTVLFETQKMFYVQRFSWQRYFKITFSAFNIFSKLIWLMASLPILPTVGKGLSLVTGES